MGFPEIATIVTTAAAVAGKAVEASAERKQARAFNAAAEERRRLAENQAAAMTRTALENQRRGQRNANAQLASARADAAASNLFPGGTSTVRELDLATRLEDDINNSTNAALQEVNTVRAQGGYDAHDLRAQASQARLRNKGAWLGAAGGLFRGLSSVDWSSFRSGSSGSNATQA
ncbi:MAG: hypothetical protein IKA23_03960 [Akkermansia sp.]|nr:hypothetical protein [Akkermansia sp.]MBR2314036.1 hypothetical protein [Akkermansia sp.]